MRTVRLNLFSFLILATLIIFTCPLLAQEEEYTLSIEEYLNNALPPQEGRIIHYNELTGILTVTDTPSNQRLIRRLIEQFDVGPRQIMIEAKFVEIQFSDLDELGIEWYWYSKNRDLETGDSGASSYKGVQWDTSTTTTFPQTSFGLDFFISHAESSSFLRAYLHALTSEGRADLLSSPKITTLSGQQANIQVTQTIPYVSEVDFENIGTAEHPIWQFEYAIEERVTGITLEVTPYVSGSSEIITLDIHPEVSTLVARRPIFVGDPNSVFSSAIAVPTMLGWPVVDTRTTQTSVMLDSGETVIMGGFVHDDDTVEKKKIPFLGDIPLIGKLFQYDYQTRTKKNLVIFLTATLITSEGDVAK